VLDASTEKFNCGDSWHPRGSPHKASGFLGVFAGGWENRRNLLGDKMTARMLLVCTVCRDYARGTGFTKT